LGVMAADTISTPDRVDELREGLGYHYKDGSFLQCKSMGELVQHSLARLEREVHA